MRRSIIEYRFRRARQRLASLLERAVIRSAGSADFKPIGYASAPEPAQGDGEQS
jgi:hypothetical protein